jgi:hypothetical protein
VLLDLLQGQNIRSTHRISLIRFAPSMSIGFVLGDPVSTLSFEQKKSLPSLLAKASAKVLRSIIGFPGFLH